MIFHAKDKRQAGEDQWRYPHGHYRNSAWYFVGEHQGVFSDPKPWHEYGLEGSIYFQAGKGYFLSKDGQPDLNNWDFHRLESPMGFGNIEACIPTTLAPSSGNED